MILPIQIILMVTGSKAVSFGKVVRNEKLMQK